MPEEGLSRRTMIGMAWAYGSYAGGRVLVLVATAILARLLTPDDFGLVALALTFTGFLDMLKDFGVAEALVVTDEEEVEDKAETAFVIMQFGGLFVFGVTVLLGPVAAGFYDEPELRWMLPALGLTFVLRSLGATHYALAQKRLDFRARTVAEMADVVVRGFTGIGLAIAGAGAWSLVVGYLAGTAAMSIALVFVVRWRPRLRPRKAHLRDLLGFGGALTGVSLVGAILASIDGLVIGRVLGTAELGLYALAARLPELLIVNLSAVAGKVLFPAFAAVEPDGLRDAFLRSLRYAAMIALPLGAFLAVLAEPLIVLAFGDQWRTAATVMTIFSLYALASPFTLVCGTMMKSRGRGGLLLRLALFQMALVVPSVIIVADKGIETVAAVHAIEAGIILFVQVFLVMRLIDVRAKSVVSAVWPPIIGSIALAAVAFALYQVTDGIVVLVVAAIAGGLVYAGVLWLTARDALQGLISAFAPKPVAVP